MGIIIKRFRLAALGAAGAAALCPFNAIAADPTRQQDEGWTMTVAPYLWASGIKGESGLFGFPPQELDVSFSDVLQHLKFGFMGVSEARKGRFTVSTDIVYARLNADIGTPHGILASKVDATVSTFMGTALGGYSVYYEDGTNFDFTAGARLWSADNRFEFHGGALDGTSVSDGDTWVDPVIGVKFKANVGNGIYLAGWGLVGGFGVGSKSMWDVMGGAGYQFNEKTSMFVGYRAVHDNYTSDGFMNKVTQQGPMLGFTYKFSMAQ
ncbi:hypothetical protein NKI77_13410 [Mesorhizobium opportunistum]|uniref:Outer membrane protein beta-barrel domain-containing protein n=1 Tax=Mesorhizobium opportunistum TaxID=593909 RepID=A0ABV1YKM6_9HYPH|nr:hypothetical protein [Mesorhizobium sp.]TJV15717.1 MAG: hypothetical protein E5Y07_20575 [Mesorhizobium sp.]